MEGQPGQPGNMGSKGTSPVGPEGQKGPPGDIGPRGPRGPYGAVGPAGPPGNNGGTGPMGDSGPAGPAGKDAKQYTPKDCGVSEASTGKKVCCGRSQVHWSSFTYLAAEIRVNTAECAFEGDVTYFPTIQGNGYQWSLIGDGVENPDAGGFTFKTTSVYYNIDGSTGNAYQWTVDWCGVGKTPKNPQTSVCCESQNYNLRSWDSGGTEVYQDTEKCGFRGSPHYIVSMSGPGNMYSVAGVRDLYAGTRSWDKSFRALPNASPNFPWRNYNDMGRQLSVNYCAFGSTFPTGEMMVTKNEITEASYPCQGVRLFEGGNLKTQTGEICCGETAPGGWTDKTASVYTDWRATASHSAVEQRVDTSSCGFKAGTNPVWLTTLKGRYVWAVSGSSSYAAATHNGFTSQMMGFKEDATTVTARKAQDWGWQIQWCGFGQR